MSNLLLIDSRVKDINILITCLTKHTEYLVFDFYNDSLASILTNLSGKTYLNIGLVQHNISYIDLQYEYYVKTEYDEYIEVSYDASDSTYISQNGEIYDISLVLTKKNTIKKWKMVETMDECILSTDDYVSWKQFTDFLGVLKLQNTTHFDFLACNLWNDDDWVNAIEYLSQNILPIRASSNNTGWEGDFILESDNFSMIDVYFTDKVLKYSFSLANEYTLTQLISGTRPICNENPIAASNNGVLASVQWGSNIYYSTDDGNTWLTATNGGNGWWVATSANGVYILATGSFSSVYLNNNSGLPTNSIRAFSSVATAGNGYTCSIDDTGKYMVYSTNNGTVYYSSSFGSTWSIIRSGTGSVTTNITRDSKYLISSQWDSSIFYLYNLAAANYGTSGSWTSYSIFPNTSRRFSQSADGSITYISTAGYIIKVTNIFSTPTRTNITVSGTPYMLACSANGKILAYTLNTSLIYVSLDEGESFTTYTTSAAIRSLGMNSAGSRIYGCNGSGTIFTKLSYNVASSVTVNNGNFTFPSLSSNSYTYYTSNLSEIAGWSISSTSNNVGIANTSSVLGYSTLPAGITQWFLSQFTNNGQTILSQNIAFDKKGTYRLSYHSSYSPSTEVSSILTIFSSVNDVSSGLIALSNTSWTNTVYDFTIPSSGTYPLTFNIELNMSSPIVHYPFDSNFNNIGTSTSTVGSAVGGASISNSVYTVGTGALSLNASSNQGFNLGTFAIPAVGFTIACWFRTAETANYKRIFNLGTNTGSNENWIQLTVNNNNNQLTFQVMNYFTTAATITLGATSTYANNAWYHVALTAQRGTTSTYKAYVNGSIVSTVTSSTAPPSANYTVNYLGSLNGTSSYTTVNIDDFRIYGRVVSAGEIANIYNSSNLNMSVYLSGITLSYINDNTNVNGIPNAPTITSLTAGNQQITVNITPASSGSSPSFYKYSLNGGSRVSVSALNTSFTITGLTNGIQYSVELYASNSFGDSASSNVLSATCGAAPDAPTLTSLSTVDKQIMVYFTAPVFDGGSAIIYYTYSLNGGADISMNTTTSPFAISGITAGVNYSVKIKAVNVYGSSIYSGALSITPTWAPSAPLLTSLVAGNQQITLYFSSPLDDGGSSITNYLYSLNGGADISMNTTISPFVITGLSAGTTYSVKIRTVNSIGVSIYSNSLSAIPYTVPTTPTITNIVPEPKSFVVSFTANTYNTSLTNIQYSVNGEAYVNASNVFSPFIIPNLTEGQEYTIIMKIGNGAGTSTASSSYSTYLPYTYQTASPTSIDMCGNLYMLTLSDASGTVTNKYSMNGVNWSTHISPILDTNIQGGVAWRGNNFNSSGNTNISFTIRGTSMNTNIITSSSNALYNINRSGEEGTYRNTLTIPTNISTIYGVLLLPHNST